MRDGHPGETARRHRLGGTGEALRRWLTLPLLSSVVAAVAGGVTAYWTTDYVAEARIFVPSQPLHSAGFPNRPGPILSPEAYGHLLRSHDLISQARASLSELSPRLLRCTDEDPTRADHCMDDEVRRRVQVKTDDASRIVEVGVRMPTPELADAVLALMLARLQEEEVRRRQREADAMTALFEGQASNLASELRGAEQRLEDLEESNGPGSRSPRVLLEVSRARSDLIRIETLHVSATAAGVRSALSAQRTDGPLDVFDAAILAPRPSKDIPTAAATAAALVLLWWLGLGLLLPWSGSATTTPTVRNRGIPSVDPGSRVLP